MARHVQTPPTLTARLPIPPGPTLLVAGVLNLKLSCHSSRLPLLPLRRGILETQDGLLHTCAVFGLCVGGAFGLSASITASGQPLR